MLDNDRDHPGDEHVLFVVPQVKSRCWTLRWTWTTSKAEFTTIGATFSPQSPVQRPLSSVKPRGDA